jgi:5-methylcytosine-specific restriction endonuclease McrA
VRRRLRRVRDSERNEAALDRMLKHFERRWRFRRLDAVTDTKENDFNIMAGMSPDVEIAEVAAKSEWPKGTRTDPIPVKWFKKPSDYTLIGGKTISSGVTLPEVGGRGRRTLFVNPSYLSMKDVVTKHRPARPKDLKKDQIREHLRALSELPDDGGRITVTEGASTLVPGNYQIDHVRDLNWKGRDIYSNLWPASETKNNAFNANNDQYVKAQMWKGGKWKTERHSARHWGNFGKYFWIADQVNVPASRGNPAGGKTPINDGKHGIPKRKPGSS